MLGGVVAILIATMTTVGDLHRILQVVSFVGERELPLLGVVTVLVIFIISLPEVVKVVLIRGVVVPVGGVVAVVVISAVVPLLVWAVVLGRR